MEERQEGSLSLTTDSSSLPSWSVFEHHHITPWGTRPGIWWGLDLIWTGSRGCLNLFYRYVCVCRLRGKLRLAKQNNWLETCYKLFSRDLDRSGQGQPLRKARRQSRPGEIETHPGTAAETPREGAKWRHSPQDLPGLVSGLLPGIEKLNVTPDSEKPCPEISWCHHWAGKQERWACLWGTK